MRQMPTMWRFGLGFICSVAVQVDSHEIKVKCEPSYDFPLTSDTPPSSVAALNVDLVRVGSKDMLNISWAINIDASIHNLAGTWLEVSMEPSRICEYSPSFASFAKANAIEVEQMWFSTLIKVTHGIYMIEVQNLPLPPAESDTTPTVIEIDVSPRSEVENMTVPAPSVESMPDRFYSVEGVLDPAPSVESMTDPVPSALRNGDYIILIFGVLGTLTILSSCCVIYKICMHFAASTLCYGKLPESSTAPVPVLVVYPAENAAFQRAVMALAEILQLHGGCTVAIDMWQRERIAELGPMRWLAEQAKAAKTVIIMSPQTERSSQLRRPLPSHSIPDASVPAATHDLYPLVLNMVASHAKNSSQLAKFLVVHLSLQKDRSSLPLELRSCKTFYLMKDLKKLCKSLYVHKQEEKKILNFMFRPVFPLNEDATVKLKEAIGQLRADEPGVPKEMQPLKYESILV
ncbi:uncharacterized protein il17rb isoform 2-T2 [Menidia menidia]